MKKISIIVGILSALLLTGCANSTSSESIPSESVSEYISPGQEPTGGSDTTETLTETEDNPIYLSPYPELMYNGELYTYGIYSAQTELGGKYYEADNGADAFIDAERLKGECEYIGESIPNPEYLIKPSRELEVTNSDEVYELYKIDEDQILLYSSKDLEIPDTWRSYAVVYPGTFRRHYILIKADKYNELIGGLEEKYYRLDESTTDISDGVFPPEGIIAPITTTSPPVNDEPDEGVPGRLVERFYLEDVEYIESTWGTFGFVIEDDGDVVIDENWVADITDPDYENKVIEALHELYSLEYVGLSYLNEHLFRYGDDLLAIANNPEGMQNNVFFKDSGYDESQYYYAYIFEAYKPHGVFPPDEKNCSDNSVAVYQNI